MTPFLSMPLPLRIVRVDDPVPALELVRPDGHGWLLTLLPYHRLTRRDWPTRGLYLVDTPRRTCRHCEGHGGWGPDYAGTDGEYGGTDWIPCTCWDPALAVRVLPLPRWTRRRPVGDPADAPF